MICSAVFNSIQDKAIKKYGKLVAEQILSPLYWDMGIMPTEYVFRFSRANEKQQDDILDCLVKGGTDEQVARRVRRYLKKIN